MRFRPHAGHDAALASRRPWTGRSLSPGPCRPNEVDPVYVLQAEPLLVEDLDEIDVLLAVEPEPRPNRAQRRGHALDAVAVPNLAPVDTGPSPGRLATSQPDCAHAPPSPSAAPFGLAARHAA